MADIRFPREVPDDVDLNAILSEIASNISGLVSGERSADGQSADPAAADRPIPGQHRLSGPAIQAPVTTVGPNAQQRASEEGGVPGSATRSEEWDVGFIGEPRRSRKRGSSSSEGDDDDDKQLAVPSPTVIIDLDVRFKDIKAAVPLFTRDLSYRSNAFVRPIVAFMNANRTLIPIHARIVMDLVSAGQSRPEEWVMCWSLTFPAPQSEFDGSMDLAQTGLLPIMSEKVYQALANHVASQNANHQRLRNVSTWSLRILADAALRVVVNVRNVFTGSNAADAQRSLAAAEEG